GVGAIGGYSSSILPQVPSWGPGHAGILGDFWKSITQNLFKNYVKPFGIAALSQDIKPVVPGFTFFNGSLEIAFGPFQRFRSGAYGAVSAADLSTVSGTAVTGARLETILFHLRYENPLSGFASFFRPSTWTKAFELNIVGPRLYAEANVLGGTQG